MLVDEAARRLEPNSRRAWQDQREQTGSTPDMLHKLQMRKTHRMLGGTIAVSQAVTQLILIGDYDGALALVDRELGKKNSNAGELRQLRIERARVRLSLGDSDAATLELREVIAELGDDESELRATVLLLQASALLSRGDAEDATRSLRESSDALTDLEQRLHSRSTRRVELPALRLGAWFYRSVDWRHIVAIFLAVFLFMALIPPLLFPLAFGSISAGMSREYPIPGVSITFWHVYAIGLLLTALWPFAAAGLVAHFRPQMAALQTAYALPGTVRMQLGDTWARLGFHEEARRQLERGRKLIETSGDPLAFTVGEMTAASAYQCCGDFAAAEQSALRAVRGLDRGSPLWLTNQANLVSSRLQADHPGSALAAAQELDQEVRRTGTRYHHYDFLLPWIEGIIAGQSKNWPLAEQKHALAYELVPPDNPLSIRIAFQYGCALSARGNSEAPAALRRSLVWFERQRARLRTSIARANFSRPYGWIFRAMPRVFVESNDTVGGASTLVRTKARTFVEQFSSQGDRYQASAHALEDAAEVQAAAARLFEVKAAAAVQRLVPGADENELVKVLAERRRRLHRSMIEDGAAALPVEIVELEDVQASLKEGELLLDVLWDDSGVLTFAIMQDSVTSRASDVSTALELVNDFRTNGRTGAREILEHLSGVSLSPFRNVFVVPDGPLAHCPLAARYEDLFDVALLPSAALLHFLRRRPLSTPTHTSRVLIVGADPRDDLPGVRYEASAIAGALMEHGVSSEKNMGDASGLFEPGRWLAAHIAAHGWLSSSQGESGLLLEADGGAMFLTTDDVTAKVRVTAPLVVLGACDLAHPTHNADMGVFGMPAAFHQACDARAVVASMAPLNDAATALIMPEFYRLMALGYCVGPALREAQRKVAALSRSQCFSLAERGWPIPDRVAGDMGKTPLRDIILSAPCLIYGDPAVRWTPVDAGDSGASS